MNRQQCFLEVRSKLSSFGIGDADAEAKILCDDVFHQNQSTSILYQDVDVSDQELARIESILAERKTGRPLAYILGQAFFYGRPFYVTDGILIPRQDTETLIEAVKAAYPDSSSNLHFIDVGVGSGNILLTLLLEYPQSTGQGTDVESVPIQVTQKNIERYQLQSRVSIEQKGYLPSQNDAKRHQTTIVVSNPPYIDINDDHLCVESTKFEPKTALFAKHNGLDIYENLIPLAAKILPKSEKNHNIFIEIGFQQQSDVSQILLKSGFHDIICKKDLAERPRILCATS